MSDAPTFLLEPSEAGVDLVVTGSWGKAAEGALTRGEADGLTLNYARGFREHNLDFLQAWPLRRLRILARTLDDLTPVYRLSATLEQLSVQAGSRTTIDLRRLPWLTAVAAEWGQISETVEQAIGLNDLFAAAYDPADLQPLARNLALSRIRMKERPRLLSLEGVQRLPALRELAVFGAAQLRDMTTLRDLVAPELLKRLQLGSCAHLDALDDVQGLTMLDFLDISECGDIASLGPLSGMNHLQTLHAYGTTRVLDSDLGPLLRLPALQDLRIMSRPAYRPTVGGVKEHMTSPS